MRFVRGYSVRLVADIPHYPRSLELGGNFDLSFNVRG